MATFGTYGSPIDMMNPADEQNSVLHDEQQLENMANAAESLVLDTYSNSSLGLNPVRGISGGLGFEGIFDDLSYEGLSRVTSIEGITKEGGRVGRYQKQIRKRTMNILTISPEEYLRTLNNSSSAALDKQIMHLQHRFTRTKINLDDMRKNSNVSLSMAKIYRASVKASREKVMSEFQENKQLNEDAIENRSKFRKIFLNNFVARKTGVQRYYDQKSNRFKQNWVGRNISKRNKLKSVQDKLEPKLSSVFDELDTKINKIESAAEKRVNRMENRLKRAFRGAKSRNAKQELWQELNNAVRNNTANFGGGSTHLAVPSLGISANMSDRQKYVDMLEALKRVDFIRDGLHAIGKSQEIHQRQKDVIESTDTQQSLIENTGDYKFDEVLSAINSKIPASTDKLSLSELVQKLEEEFHTNPNLTNSPLDGDTTQLDLMTDAYKLIKFINALGENPVMLVVFDVKLQSQLKGWIVQNYQEEAVGNTKEYKKANAQEAKKSLDFLQGDDGFKAILKYAKELSSLESLMVSDLDQAHADLIKFEENFNKAKTAAATATATATATDKINDSYKEYLSNRARFPNSDQKVLDELWRKLNDAILEIDRSYQENFKISSFNQAQLKKVQDLQNERDDTTKTPRTVKKIVKGKVEEVENPRIAELNRDIRNIKFKQPVSTNFSSLIANLNREIASSFKISGEQNALESKNDVFQRILEKEFQQEMEKKALDNMEKNDQFEMLSKCPKGMKVEVDYKVVNATNSVKFPKQLTKDETLHCTIQKIDEKNGKKIIYLKSNATDNKVITLMGPAIKDGKPMKNGYLKTLHNRAGDNTFRASHEPEHGGAGIQIMTTNMRIAA